MRLLTLAELAAESGTDEVLVSRFVDLGEIRALPDGRFDARDTTILTTVRALLDAGIELATSCGRSRPGHSASAWSGGCSPSRRRTPGHTASSETASELPRIARGRSTARSARPSRRPTRPFAPTRPRSSAISSRSGQRSTPRAGPMRVWRAWLPTATAGAGRPVASEPAGRRAMTFPVTVLALAVLILARCGEAGPSRWLRRSRIRPSAGRTRPGFRP
jgi:hypothetical protein